MNQARHLVLALNLGCGHKRYDGYVGVDRFASPAVDVVHDLESAPWPWPDNSVDKVLLVHVLEHLGQQPYVYLRVIQELYRVCKNGAEIEIRVPHPRHSDFLNDPTHVRPVTPEGFMLFSQKSCQEFIRTGAANTPLAIQLGVDFEIKHVAMAVEPEWKQHPDIAQAMRRYNNVIKEITIKLVAIKG